MTPNYALHPAVNQRRLPQCELIVADIARFG